MNELRDAIIDADAVMLRTSTWPFVRTLTRSEWIELITALSSPADIRDALLDSNYLAGAKAGFNRGLNEDHEGMKRLQDSREGYLKPIADRRRHEKNGDFNAES